MLATIFLMSLGVSCSLPTMSLRRSRAMAVMVMVETKTDVPWRSPIIRHAN
jgi:hypothetical protein